MAELSSKLSVELLDRIKLISECTDKDDHRPADGVFMSLLPDILLMLKPNFGEPSIGCFDRSTQIVWYFKKGIPISQNTWNFTSEDKSESKIPSNEDILSCEISIYDEDEGKYDIQVSLFIINTYFDKFVYKDAFIDSPYSITKFVDIFTSILEPCKTAQDPRAYIRNNQK